MLNSLEWNDWNAFRLLFGLLSYVNSNQEITWKNKIEIR